MQTQFPRMIDISRYYPLSPSWDFSKKGIANLRKIVSVVIRLLRDAGARPFIVPAMGSHGGATPEGQTQVLKEYGITSESMHVPIDARIDVRRRGASENGIDVYFSEAALASDGIVVINRIKPHTDFSGSVGSGILKMIAIGLGKHQGAAVCFAGDVHVSSQDIGVGIHT